MKTRGSPVTESARQPWRGLITLIEREYYRFGRLAGQTIAPPIISTLLFIVIFGYSLGQRIENVAGFSYILYILPGLIAMSVMNNAFSNSSTSLYMARIDRSLENIMVSPLSHFEIVASFVIGGLTRGLVVGGTTLLIGVLAAGLKIHSLVGTFASLALISILFSSLGILSALWAEDWDHIATFTNFVLTPLAYLGGIFYAVDLLPPLWQRLSWFNPLFYLVDCFRGQVLGVSAVRPAHSFLLLTLLALGSLLFSVHLFRRGWKIIH